MKYAYAMILVLLLAGTARAECDIEAWRFTADFNIIEIEGATTCEKGLIRIRAYDADDKFIGVAMGVIQGFTFVAHVNNAPANIETMGIKYRIEE